MLFQLSIFNFLSTFQTFYFLFKLHYCSENVRYDILATTFARGIYGNPRLQSPNLPKHQLLHTVIWKSSCAYSVAILVWTHNVYIEQSLTPRNSIDAHFSHQYLKPQINIKNQVYTFAKHTPTINHHRWSQ